MPEQLPLPRYAPDEELVHLARAARRYMRQFRTVHT